MIDLFLEPSVPRRISAQLYEQLRDAIVSGRLAPGDRLPASRDLAHELGVARSTVTTTYGRLVGEGFLAGRIGAGTFVADHPARRSDPVLAPRSALRSRRQAAARRRPVPLANPVVDLRTGRPDPALFPLVDWRRCVASALQSPPPGYGDEAGLPELRRSLAAWASRSRGVVASPDQVLVTAGAQQAFDLCARALLAPGEVIAFENPGYAPARSVFEHHGATVEPVPIDTGGIVVERIPAPARAVYVTPSHQSPTGVTMSPSRRRALLELAVAGDAVIIEDDYDTEYRYVDRPLEPLQRLDTSGRVIYVGSFSKTLSPSLRLGFMVGPEPLISGLVDTRALSDCQPPHLTQAALATFLANGGFERHLRRARRVYRERHELVTEHLAQLATGGLIAHQLTANAGLHCTIELRAGSDAAAVAATLAARGIAIDTTCESWATRPRPGLMIGFGLADLPGLEHALGCLRSVLERG